MAYADQDEGLSTNRVIAISIVALLHAGLGYGLVTGLAYDAAKQVFEDLKTFDVQEEVPEEPEEPPPPPEKLDIPPPPKVTAPPPVNVTPVISTNTQAVVITPSAPPAPPPPPPAPPAPPPPAAPSVAEKATPRGDPGSWATPEDYPPASLRNEEQGTTGFRLEIGTDGKATSCSITKSSGFSALDDATCKFVSRRARFKPAKDASGNPITDTYSSRVRWQIPK
jgi:periplasmic protein TonB